MALTEKFAHKMTCPLLLKHVVVLCIRGVLLSFSDSNQMKRDLEIFVSFIYFAKTFFHHVYVLKSIVFNCTSI